MSEPDVCACGDLGCLFRFKGPLKAAALHERIKGLNAETIIERKAMPPYEFPARMDGVPNRIDVPLSHDVAALEHELAVLRPDEGDLVVLYLPENARSAQPVIDLFIRAVCRTGAQPLVMPYGGRVEKLPDGPAKLAYAALKKRFDGC